MHIISNIYFICIFHEIDEKGMEEPDILTLNNIKHWWNLAKSVVSKMQLFTFFRTFSDFPIPVTRNN